MNTTEPLNSEKRAAWENDSQAHPGANAFIQWKGTNVCMDVRCPCGYLGHIDSDFAYFYKCRKCGVSFVVGCHISIYPLSAEAAAQITSGLVVSEPTVEEIAEEAARE